MRNVAIIAKKELRSYFNQPVAYIVVSAFLLVAGWMFFSAFFVRGTTDMRPYFQPSWFSPAVLLVILAPAITMRLIAEEKKAGTIELLTTMPIRRYEIILGKFVAALGLITAALGVTLLSAISVAMVGDLDWGPVVAGYFGLLLFSAALLAIGLLCSTLTRNQIVAFIVGFLVCAALYFVYWLRMFLPTGLSEVAEYVSMSFHLENIARGVIDTRGVIYYLSVTGGALFLAERSLARQHA